MKLNNYFIYFMILSFTIFAIFDIVWKELILLTIFIYIIINILALKPLADIDDKEELATFPLVSIIIPAWNEESILKRTIINILNSTYPNFELIIVAGGEDKTFEIADNFLKIDNRIKIIKQEPLGKNAALNKGLKNMTGEIVIFLDADSLVEENWLLYLVKPIINREANITVANFKPYIENYVSIWYYLYHSYLKIVAGKTGFFGGSIAFEKTVFGKGMALDERATADDYYLFILLGKQYKIKFIKESIFRTDIPSTLKKFLITEARWFRNKLQTTLLFNKGWKEVIFSFSNAIYFTLGVPVWFFLSDILKNGSFIFLKVWIIYFSLLTVLNLVKPLALYRMTRNSIWLRYAWVVLFFPLIEYLLQFYALLTYRKVTLFFKGSRKL